MKHGPMMKGLHNRPPWATELPWCDHCHRQFGSPPQEQNTYRYKDGTREFKCDACIEREIEENWKYRP